MERVKLLSMTAVLTVLVWASADSLVNETVSVSVLFEVLPPRDAQNMLIAPQADPTLYELGISGPRKVVEAAQAQGPLNLRLRIDDRPTGPATIHLDRDFLRQALGELSKEFRKLTVVSVAPDTMQLRIDHIIRKDIEVVVKRLALAYEIEPQLQRSAATILMRESSFNRLPADQPLQIEIGPEVERLLAEQPAGKSVTVPVTLDVRPFGPDASITPPAVDVTATIRARRVTAQIPTVPILLAMSFANLERPLRPVTRDGTLLSLVTQTITVTGLREDVARLQRGETRAYGVIQLKQEDLEALDQIKLVTPDYFLPKRVELAQDPVPIEFKLLFAGGIDNGS